MLDIYERPNPTTAFTEFGDLSNALAVSCDGVLGETIELKLYLRNDDPLYYYTSISIQPVDGGDDIVDGTGANAGYKWKLYTGDSQPLEEQWSLTAAGNSISLPNLGTTASYDIATYLPFWVRIEVPAGAPVAAYQGVSLVITFTETAIGS